MRRWRAIVVAGVLAGSVCLGGAATLLLTGGTSAVASAARPGAVDIGFAQQMSIHHAQAIAMADIVARNPDRTVVSLAHAIRTAQLEEIGRFQGFLSLWSASALPGEHHGASMPGMATTTQLQALRAVTGERQAQLFLQLMLRHHRGGIEMAHVAARDATLAQVRSLAAKIAFDQDREITVIGQLLRSGPERNTS